jgi:hypothetical protein
MARNEHFSAGRCLTFSEQIHRMAVICPWFNLHSMRRQVEALWFGEVRPTAVSDLYTVSLRHRANWCPEVRVASPALRIRPGAKSLPHVYGDGSLCLHTLSDWQPSRFIADFVVPWVSIWLYFYEVWFATGLWIGGGTHPEKPEHCSQLTPGRAW